MDHTKTDNTTPVTPEGNQVAEVSFDTTFVTSIRNDFNDCTAPLQRVVLAKSPEISGMMTRNYYAKVADLDSHKRSSIILDICDIVTKIELINFPVAKYILNMNGHNYATSKIDHSGSIIDIAGSHSDMMDIIKTLGRESYIKRFKEKCHGNEIERSDAGKRHAQYLRAKEHAPHDAIYGDGQGNTSIIIPRNAVLSPDAYIRYTGYRSDDCTTPVTWEMPAYMPKHVYLLTGLKQAPLDYVAFKVGPATSFLILTIDGKEVLSIKNPGTQSLWVVKWTDYEVKGLRDRYMPEGTSTINISNTSCPICYTDSVDMEIYYSYYDTHYLPHHNTISPTIEAKFA